MRFVLVLLLTLIQLSGANAHSTSVGDQDHYRSFEELARNNVAGKDYEIQIQRFNSPVLVMAFHGGLIEPGTTELGEELSRGEFNFYTFIGKKNRDVHEPSFTSADLHLTSARFDEPQLLKLTSESQSCVALHGFGGEEADFCVGGANPEMRKAFVSKLGSALPEYRSCELCCPPYNGVSLKNPANRCQTTGVQIEMSPAVRRRILVDETFKKGVAQAMKEVLQ